MSKVQTECPSDFVYSARRGRAECPPTWGYIAPLDRDPAVHVTACTAFLKGRGSTCCTGLRWTVTVLNVKTQRSCVFDRENI